MEMQSKSQIKESWKKDKEEPALKDIMKSKPL